MLKATASFLSKTLIWAVFFSFILVSIVALRVYKETATLEGKIYPSVRVDGTDFGRKTVQDLQTYFLKKNSELEAVVISVEYKQTSPVTFSGRAIALRYDIPTITHHAMSIGRSGTPIARTYQKFASILGFGHVDLSSTISYTTEPVDEHIDYLATLHNSPPENALFRIEGNRVAAFKIEQDGIEIRKADAKEALRDGLKNLDRDKPSLITIKITEKIIKPEVTLSAINDFGIIEKIGEGRSDYTGSAWERVHNIKLATSRINGTLIPRGATFSFNNTVGDISASTGYKSAYIIKGGETVLGDGGGVCQVSTTLFRAALNTGLPITQRRQHAYRVRYYENDRKPGFDATVFSPTVDFKFTNDTPAHILIQTGFDDKNNILTFSLYGKRDDRNVEISDATVWDVKPPPEPLYKDDPTLPKGQTKQVDFAAWRAKATFHYRVVKDGEITQDHDFYSSFRPWQAVFLVGTGG